MKEAVRKRKAAEYHERFEAELGREWKRLTDFEGSHEMLTAKHIPCGDIRTAPARDFFRRGCRTCERKKAVRDRFEKRGQRYVQDIERQYNVTSISEYKGAREPHRWRCNECGAIMCKTVENILWRDGDNAGGLVCDCHITEPTARVSAGVMEIIRYLRDRRMPYMREVWFDTCRLERPLPFDFIIYDEEGHPTHAIEYNGAQHYEACEAWGGEEGLKRRQEAALKKKAWCKREGLPLLSIRYDVNIIEYLEMFLS
jgi:hypothetical protein